MDLGFGLTKTTWVMTVLLVAVIAVQFALNRYVPAAYWLTVVLVSIVGTWITDNLTDTLHIPLMASTNFFTAALIAMFVSWYLIEHTLSIQASPPSGGKRSTGWRSCSRSRSAPRQVTWAPSSSASDTSSSARSSAWSPRCTTG
jgi:uncharacterized membrane-anchored protein